MSFSFKCKTCGERHEGLPSFGPEAPLSYAVLDEEDQKSRAELGTDDCIIDDQYYFVRGRLQLPIIGQTEPFVWLVWCSLSLDSYAQWREMFGEKKRAHVGQFFGWLNVQLPFYEDTLNFATSVQLVDAGSRPLVIVQEADNQLYFDQRDGLSQAKVEMMVHDLLHPEL
ncbi:DUF2199 domain-containing protein [Ruegeria lacuscaerulensis]|uniref:DUF2199 domain-containing protein n=1 Tax=Ruegeria lacuscaerulensis TaxID=55218 RepID=UPI00147B8515|nr:DUF2199 domain-containing protein [Ruegeria lacuscaerulensis]